MDWTAFLSALLGGALSIGTAVVTNWFQLKRDKDARVAEDDRGREEYDRRLQEERRERVRAEAATIAQAVAKTDRLAALVAVRRPENTHLAPATDFIEEDEIGEWSQAVADANASALALSMYDGGLGDQAAEVITELRTTLPGESTPFLDETLAIFMSLVRDYLAQPLDHARNDRQDSGNRRQ